MSSSKTYDVWKQQIYEANPRLRSIKDVADVHLEAMFRFYEADPKGFKKWSKQLKEEPDVLPAVPEERIFYGITKVEAPDEVEAQPATCTILEEPAGGDDE